MGNFEDVNWGLLLPLIVLQFILMIIGLVDLAKREQTATRGPKLMWVIIVIVLSIVGPVAYFTIGRRNDA